MDERPISGTLNFRSVAPYAAVGGRLRPDTLYRCGAFDGIGSDGIDCLKRIGLTTIFDLRSEQEKERAPSPLLFSDDFRVVSHPHRIRSGDLVALVRDPGATPDAAGTVMKAIYARLPLEFTAVFRVCFRTAVDSDLPFAVHCTAGKDRTGIAIALLLDMLGVDRGDIMEDYLRTNAARDALMHRIRNRTGSEYAEVSEAVLDRIVTANPAYIEAMFATVDEQFGNANAYAAQMLDLSAQDQTRLRQHLLE